MYAAGILLAKMNTHYHFSNFIEIQLTVTEAQAKKYKVEYVRKSQTLLNCNICFAQ